MPLRAEFREALSLLASAIRTLTDKGLEPPVLVGGAAVEFYTGSAVTSGDFDFVTPHQAALESALIERGFERPSGVGSLLVGLFHRKTGLGVQVVSGSLMGGKAERSRMRAVEIDGADISIIPVEDLIADRMGQAYSDRPPRQDMLDQAFQLLQLADELDEAYLARRIVEETAGESNLRTLRAYRP